MHKGIILILRLDPILAQNLQYRHLLNGPFLVHIPHNNSRIISPTYTYLLILVPFTRKINPFHTVADIGMLLFETVHQGQVGGVIGADVALVVAAG